MEPELESGERSAKRLRTAVRTVVVLVVLVLGSLAVFFWIHTEEAAVDQYNRTSVALARVGALRIAESVALIEQRLSILGQVDCEAAPCPARQEQLLAELAPFGAIDVLQLREADAVERAVRLAAPLAEERVRAARAQCAPGGFCFAILRDLGPPVDEQAVLMNGRAAALFDWPAMGRHLTEGVALGPDGLAWLLDEAGHLLFHPSNPNICNETVQRVDSRCQVCHAQSEAGRQIDPVHVTAGAFDVAGVPKLVAFAPIQVASKVWVLAVAVPYGSVVSDNRAMLGWAITLSSLLIGLFLAVTYILDRENRHQIGVLSVSQRTIHRLNTDLESKVRARTEELRHLIEQMNDFHRRFEGRERLAIVGELAAVVAHEIRNPLNALAINAERLQRRLRNVEPALALAGAQEMVESQVFEVRRINSYIEQYLRLARAPERRVVRSDLNRLIRDLLKFLEVEAERLGIRLHHAPASEAPVAEVDEDQIRQVLLNLIVNAFQAMPQEGNLTVETSVSEGSVLIKVQDTGVGIAREQMAELFKPFFTTREGGTGLGLAISARIVKEHRGELTCDSEVGRGTTFSIRLPLLQVESA